MTKKIAIPSTGTVVNAHFGRSQAFTLYEIDGDKIISEQVIDTTGFEHQHEGISQLFKFKGVETVICGGIGPGAIAGLEAAGLEVLRGASGDVRQVAEAYANGTLASTDAVCDHSHGHDHHHH